MRIRFFWVATLWAVWECVVVINWVFFPTVPLGLWEMPVDEAGISLGLRVAALCLGSATILFMARREPPSGARRAISYGTAAGNTAAAAIGIYSLATGIASVWILQAVILELIAAAGFVLAERAPRRMPVVQENLGNPK